MISDVVFHVSHVKNCEIHCTGTYTEPAKHANRKANLSGKKDVTAQQHYNYSTVPALGKVLHIKSYATKKILRRNTFNARIVTHARALVLNINYSFIYIVIFT